MGGNGEATVNGYIISFRGDKNILNQTAVIVLTTYEYKVTPCLRTGIYSKEMYHQVISLSCE